MLGMPTPVRRCCSGEQRAGCLRDATGLRGRGRDGEGKEGTVVAGLRCNEMRQMQRTRGGGGGGGVRECPDAQAVTVVAGRLYSKGA